MIRKFAKNIKQAATDEKGNFRLGEIVGALLLIPTIATLWILLYVLGAR